MTSLHDRFFAIEGTFAAITELDPDIDFESDYLNAPTWDVGLWPFLIPEGVTIESSVDKVAPGITVYREITLPPAAGYRWHSEDQRVAKAPQWLIDLIVGKPSPPPPPPEPVPAPPPPPEIAAAPPLALEPPPGAATDKPATSIIGPGPVVLEWCHDEASLGCIPFIYGKHLIRGAISLTIAPPGVGKTSVKVTESAALATGLRLLHDEPTGKLRAWYHNGEEDMATLKRRFHATFKKLGITKEQIGDRIFVSDIETKMVIAKETRDGVRVMEPVKEAMIDHIRRNKLDTVTIDPFVSGHEVAENDNGAIDKVARAYLEIAQATGSSFDLVVHTRKTNGGPITIEDARGASSQVGVARAARVLNVMSAEEANRAGVESRTQFVRIDDAKANFAGRRTTAQWVNLQGVVLASGADVGVATPWQLPDAAEGIADTDLEPVWAAIRAGEWRKDSQAGAWVGKPIATALGLDLTRKADDAKVKALTKKWLKDKKLTTVEKKDPTTGQRKLFPFVEVANG